MRETLRKLWGPAKGVLAVFLWAVVFEILHLRGMYPEKWVAEKISSMIDLTSTAVQQELVLWSLIAALAAATLLAEHWLPPILKRWFAKSSKSEATPFSKMAAKVYPNLPHKPWWETFFKRVIRDDVTETRVIPIIPPTPPDADFETGFKRAIFEENKRDKGAVLLRLTDLRETGVILRNSPIGFLLPNDLKTWFHDIDEWTDDVITALKNINIPDSKWFETLDTLPPARIAIPNIRMAGEQSRFELTFRSHDLRLVRLTDLLKKYGVGA